MKSKMGRFVQRILSYPKVAETIDRKGGDSVRQGVHRIHDRSPIDMSVEGYVHPDEAAFDPNIHGVRTAADGTVGYGRSAATREGTGLGLREKNRKGNQVA